MNTEVTSGIKIPDLTDQTPLMRQYWELKAQAGDALLLFRMGDFYELFGDDAVTAAEILEITLTSRDKNKPNPMPMAGVPHHSIQGYIQRLLKAGKKVAIGEQLSDEAEATNGKNGSKIVRREIIRTLTPGVQFDAEGYEANYLATAVAAEKGLWVLSCLDASTGESLVSDPITLGMIAHEIRRLPIRHFLVMNVALDLPQLGLADSILIEHLPPNYLSQEKAGEVLKKHYVLDNLQAFIGTPAGVLALGGLVTYALRTQQQEVLAHLQLPEPLQKPKSLVLGPNTAQHLDLTDLFQLINRTRSTLGTRQLKRWLHSPLCAAPEIKMRQEAIQEIESRWTHLGERISKQLSNLYDLERICGRVNTQLANPRDTLALGQSLQILKNLSDLFSSQSTHSKPNSALLRTLSQKTFELCEILSPLSDKILQTQKEDAPLTARDGGIFKKGTTHDLDRLISLTEDGQRWLVELETRERELTGIPSLKVRYNRVFGYYIEVTQAHLKNVPSHYQRKQTMVGAERFFTDELKKFEEEILTASVRQKSLENELFLQLIEEIQKHTSSIMEAARIFGELDSLVSLAQLARQPGWCFPIIDESLALEIQAGRHPMVDQARPGHFVPNDLFLSPLTRLTLLITGPNMGGKSTVMRQTALIVILGQMGSPVPANQARWGAVSSLYTRIGAQDAIARGQSTFMVEMSELAHILHYADSRSLIILDEIGRGTSTYDGMSVAWATLEWICKKIQARTLFATHYHELIRLASTLPLLANAHMAVDAAKSPSQQKIRFLYELREGPTNESYGIHVAQLAGLPKPVIQRAWKILDHLESQSGETQKPTNQLSLFDGHRHAVEEGIEESMESQRPEETVKSPHSHSASEPVVVIKHEPHPILNELDKTNVNDLTPIQALNFVVKLQELRKSNAG